MPSCCVKTCPNRGGLIGVTFHKVPFKMKDTWYNILTKHGVKNVSIHMAVCSDHFQPKDLDKDGFRTILKRGAVPRLYLDKPKPRSSEKLKTPQVHNKLVRFVKVGTEKKQKKRKNLLQQQFSKKEQSKIGNAFNQSEIQRVLEIKLIETDKSCYRTENIPNERQTKFTSNKEETHTKPQNDEITGSTWFNEGKVEIVDIKSILISENI